MHFLFVMAAIASWYGNAENGTATASGRPYHENEMTCAHKSLPFGTQVKVSANGKSIVCTVTDRGPYIKGRSIDLSKAGARELGMLGSGVAQVDLQIVSGSPGPVAGPAVGHPKIAQVGRQLQSASVEKSPKQSHSKASPHRGKPRSQGQHPHHKTKPSSAWQETLRNLRSN